MNNEEIFEELSKMKYIRVRCPYCGKWHQCRFDVRKENEFEYACMHANLRCDYRIKDVLENELEDMYVRVLEERDRLVHITVEMSHPCKMTCDVDSDLYWKVDVDEILKENEITVKAHPKKICIKKIIKLENVDEAIKNFHDIKDDEEGEKRETYEEKLKKAIKGCKGYKRKDPRCIGCLYSGAEYKKEDVFAMEYPLEIEFCDDESFYEEEEEESSIEGITNKEVEKENSETKTKKEETKNGGKKSMMFPIDINKIGEELGIEFGLNTDERIQSTMLGTVVEYKEGKFRGFDRENKLMTEYNELVTVSLPSILLPSTTVKVGDTIIHSGDPMFVVKAEPDDVWGVNPLTSKEEKLLPIANPLGVKTYTRLISAGEILGFKGSKVKNTKIFMWLITIAANKLFSEGIDTANEKIKEVTAKGEKYLDLLAPFACVAFAAYAMKGEDMRASNISNTAKEMLGVDIDALKNKKNIKRIAAIGVATAAAITCFKGTVKKAEDYDGGEFEEEEVTNGLDKLLKAIKPWEGTIQKVLPTAIVICAIGILKGGPKIEEIKDKVEGFILIAQDKLSEKFGIDEDFLNAENIKKIGALIGIAVAVFAIYGKKLNGKDKNTEEANGMIKQIIPVIAPLIPAIIIFAPELKAFFGKYSDDIIESDMFESDLENEEDSTEEYQAGTDEDLNEEDSEETPAEEESPTGEEDK